MATAFTHALVGGIVGASAPRSLPRARLAAAGAVLAALPDLDVISFHLEIPYAHPLGHRGFSHSLLFAAIAGPLAAVLLLGDRLRSRTSWVAAALLTLATASHGLLDAFTDAGRGIGFLIPLTDARFFFPWRPLATSPIGVDAFFRHGSLAVLWNEIRWVWLPIVAATGLLSLVRRRPASRA